MSVKEHYNAVGGPRGILYITDASFDMIRLIIVAVVTHLLCALPRSGSNSLKMRRRRVPDLSSTRRFDCNTCSTSQIVRLIKGPYCDRLLQYNICSLSRRFSRNEHRRGTAVAAHLRAPRSLHETPNLTLPLAREWLLLHQMVGGSEIISISRVK